RRVDRQPVFAGQMRDDGLAVADGLALVDEIGQLSARRRRRIENVLMHEGKAGETQEREDLQPIAVVVGDTEEHRIAVQRDHDRARVNDMGHPPCGVFALIFGADHSTKRGLGSLRPRRIARSRLPQADFLRPDQDGDSWRAELSGWPARTVYLGLTLRAHQNLLATSRKWSPLEL